MGQRRSGMKKVRPIPGGSQVPGVSFAGALFDNVSDLNCALTRDHVRPALTRIMLQVPLNPCARFKEVELGLCIIITLMSTSADLLKHVDK